MKDVQTKVSSSQHTETHFFSMPTFPY